MYLSISSCDAPFPSNLPKEKFLLFVLVHVSSKSPNPAKDRIVFLSPPNASINSLISYVNTIIYTRCLSEIYKTQINPTISYLHEPSERRFSLCLDI